MGFLGYWVFQTPPLLFPGNMGGFNEWGWVLLVLMLTAGLMLLYHYAVSRWRQPLIAMYMVLGAAIMVLGFALFAVFTVNLSTVGTIVVGVLSAIVIIIFLIYALWNWQQYRCYELAVHESITCVMTYDAVEKMAKLNSGYDPGYLDVTTSQSNINLSPTSNTFGQMGQYLTQGPSTNGKPPRYTT
jgi:hypothetical protein